MIRVAIVGCGKIADQHVEAISRVAGCLVVAVCDRELLMARQLAERFKIGSYFADISEMLRESSPTVVHITTPPQAHYSLGKQCLEAGCHVYLEKPFTVTGSEARALVELAKNRKLRLTAGHNYQFTPEAIAMRSLVDDGFLGGAPTHVECHFSYDLGDVSYVGPILANRQHWVRQLPGQLLHNILSHPVAKLAEYLGDDVVDIVARADQSPALRKMGGGDVYDELRVLLKDSRGTTAFLCFTTQIKPGLNQLRVCGPSQSLLADQSCGTLILFENRSYKSYLTFFGPPYVLARQYFHNARRNVIGFIRRRLFLDFGMKELIAKFYQSIQNPTLSPPIPYREILLTASIMDRIFAEIYPEANVAKVPESPS